MNDAYANATGAGEVNAPADPEGAGGDYTVCITSVGDGTYTVAVQESGAEAQGEGADPGDAPQTANDIDEALDLARQMLDQESQESDGDAPVGANAQQVWDQMASKRSKDRASM